MIDNPNFKISEERKIAIYEESLEMHGWPKWPPTELPQNYDWWKEEIMVLPEGFPRLPNAAFIGLDGTPKSGKSYLATELEKIYSYDPHNELEILDPDKLSVLSEEGYKFVPIEALYSQSFDIDSEPMASDFEEKSLVDILFRELWKNQYWMNQIQNFITNYPSDGTTRTIIGQRSPSDISIFINSYLTTRDPSYQIPKEWSAHAQKFWLPLTADAQINASFSDAIILIGTSQEVAQKRRKLTGAKGVGLVDSSIFNDLSAWYGYWIKNVWPKLCEYCGMGLLVLNGEKPPEENITKILNFIYKVNERRLPSYREKLL